MDNQKRDIPQPLSVRDRLRRDIAAFVKDKCITPPVDMGALRQLSLEFRNLHGISETWGDWLMVEIHNSIWELTIAGIPYDRRLLLLPKCLSNSSRCEAEVDELGLLCHQCGRCVIPDLQDYAEKHGVMSIVAEGFTSVIELIENNVVDAVIGVSCLDSLEKAFPLLVNHAVPGMAIPLNQSGCKDTTVDVEYVKRLLPMHSEQTVSLLNYDSIRTKVNAWFSADQLAEYFPQDDATAQIAFAWLTADGKRWRPFLLTAIYETLTSRNGVPSETIPQEVRLAALAVECFHKASLVHDDIQDQDTERYGQPTVFVRYGTPMAINVGDYLLGIGYRLLAQCHMPELVEVIADAHIALCMGQGTELQWNGQGDMKTLSLDNVISIFRQKTVPAFQVALELGLICAGGSRSPLRDVLRQYSEALGIAYQLNDDLDDAHSDNETNSRPSAICAYRNEHPELSMEEVIAHIGQLSERYHQDSLNTLGRIDNLELKRLLFQVTEKMKNHK